MTPLPPGPGVEIVGHCEGCTGDMRQDFALSMARAAEESP